jgi:hypothetical protein
LFKPRLEVAISTRLAKVIPPVVTGYRQQPRDGVVQRHPVELLPRHREDVCDEIVRTGCIQASVVGVATHGPVGLGEQRIESFFRLHHR